MSRHTVAPRTIFIADSLNVSDTAWEESWHTHVGRTDTKPHACARSHLCTQKRCQGAARALRADREHLRVAAATTSVASKSCDRRRTDLPKLHR
jgi:hypothetical protein